jgi:diaminopimelate decarboxylase
VLYFNFKLKGFDCASLEELKYLQKVLGLKYSEDIIFANPIKQPSHMVFSYLTL